MATLHGVVIADPARKNVKFSNVERDQFNVLRKESGRPLSQFVSSQEEFNNFPRFMNSPSSEYSVNECTVPMSMTLNNEMLDVWRTRKANLQADVEKPQLEADKYLVDQGMNRGAYFDPAGNYSTAKFKQTSRPNLRTIRPLSSRFSQSNVFAKAAHYLYVDGQGSYQDVYYKNNPRKDSKGRINLLDRPFTRTWA